MSSLTRAEESAIINTLISILIMEETGLPSGVATNRDVIKSYLELKRIQLIATMGEAGYKELVLLEERDLLESTLTGIQEKSSFYSRRNLHEPDVLGNCRKLYSGKLESRCWRLAPLVAKWASFY